MKIWTMPVKTEWMKSQVSHTPSMDYARNIHDVAVRKKNGDALEIGGAWGFSTLALLDAGVKTLTTVDANGDVEAPREAAANDYTNHTFKNFRSEDFWKQNEHTFDLIYIDGSHLYEDVRNDIYQAWNVLRADGLMMLDDWDHLKNIRSEGHHSEYGVSLATFEFWRDHVAEVKDVGILGRVLWFQKRT